MTHDNPATRLYQTWLTLYRQYHEEVLLHREFEVATSLDDVNSLSRARILPHGLQHLYRDFAYAPACMDKNGDPIFVLGRLYSGCMNDKLFLLDAQGRFRLGPCFNTYLPRGAYDGVSRFTFIRSDRDYFARGRIDNRIWWVERPGKHRFYMNTRNWQDHTLYWFKYDMPIATWFYLQRQGGTWVAQVAPGQEGFDDLDGRLTRAYEHATDYYAKWRRRHFQQEGIPDPHRRLDASEIETVDYIAQYINTYDPPKAHIPSRGESTLLGS